MQVPITAAEHAALCKSLETWKADSAKSIVNFSFESQSLVIRKAIDGYQVLGNQIYLFLKDGVMTLSVSEKEPTIPGPMIVDPGYRVVYIPGKEIELPEKLKVPASFSFEVRSNGVLLPVPLTLSCTIDGLRINFGKHNSFGVGENTISFPNFGEFAANGLSERLLMQNKARLEKALAELANILVKDVHPSATPSALIDLATGHQIVEKGVEIRYRFTEPRIETVMKKVKQQASVYCVCLAAPPTGDEDPVYGKSKDGACKVGMHGDLYELDACDFKTKRFGHVSIGDHPKFTADQIQEAFQDLCQQLLARPSPAK